MFRHALTFRSTAIAATTLTLAFGALAAPTPEAVPPALAPGFVVEWVQVDAAAGSPDAPHSIADALAILDRTGGFTELARTTQILPTIDVHDPDVPFPGVDPVFAIRVTGFVTLDAGIYSFIASHDDGISLSLGGEEIIRYDGDTGIIDTASPEFTLTAGVYSFSAVSWEQGGAFDLVFRQVQPGRNPTLVAGNHNPVPEPGSLLLAALAGGVLLRRRRH